MSEWILGWAAKMKPEFSRLLTLVKTSSIISVVQMQAPDKKPVVYCNMGGGDGKYVEGSLQDFLVAYHAARRVAPTTGTRSATLTKMCLGLNRQELINKIEESDEEHRH